jgi:YbgC/YbaW family acyl-CoA thioester hydrolase
VERGEFRYFLRLRVRWPEVDAQRVVFNGQYLAYFDAANSGYWRAAGLPYPAAFARAGGDTFVKKASLEYFASATYDDFVDAGMKCARIGTSSLAFTGAFFREDMLLATAELLYVFVDVETRRPKPFPEAMREAVTAFEAGESPFRAEAGRWPAVAVEVRALRDEAPDDAASIHVVVRDRAGAAVATGRLQAGAELGGLAVHPSMRGAGLARRVVASLADEASKQGSTRITARGEAALLERLGFRLSADGFSLAVTRQSENHG